MTLEPWQCYKFKITIQTDESGVIFDVNISELPYPVHSISTDEIGRIGEIIKELLEN